MKPVRVAIPADIYERETVTVSMSRMNLHAITTWQTLSSQSGQEVDKVASC